MRALVENAQGYDVVLVASNKPDAAGIAWARTGGLATWARDSKGIEKEEFDGLLSEALEEHSVGTIALAGRGRARPYQRPGRAKGNGGDCPEQ